MQGICVIKLPVNNQTIMNNSDHFHSLNRRDFISKTLKASGSVSLAMAGIIPLKNDDIRNYYGSLTLRSSYPDKIVKEPAAVNVVFLYPPADVVNAGKNEDSWASDNWFTWPGNQFEPEKQEKIFTSKIKEIAGNLGVKVNFATKALFQKAKIDEYIRKTRDEKPDAVLVVNFWNTFSKWSFEIATQAASASIVYQPVGSNHQLPPSDLMNTKGIYYIHSIENWAEIERGLLAVRAKKMLSQSRLLRVSDQKETLVQSRDETLGVDITGVNADEFNKIFDAVMVENSIINEAMEIKKSAQSVIDVEDHYFIEGIRAHHAVGQIMEKFNADAITIQCLMLKHRKPCLSFSINNGNLIPCGCENHLDGTLTQMIGRWLLERAGFMHNPEFDINNNHYFGAHCTCATKLQGPDGPRQDYSVRPFFHQLPKTAALDVQWTPGDPVILTKYFSGQNKLTCWTGRVIKSPQSPPTGGCATRVLAEIDNVENVCDIYPGPHPILFRGTKEDAKRIKAFAKLYGLELSGNI